MSLRHILYLEMKVKLMEELASWSIQLESARAFKALRLSFSYIYIYIYICGTG